MPEPESDKGKNILDAYSDSSIRKEERPMSNLSLVSFHINTRGKQDTSIPSLGREIRRKANFTWGFVQTHTHKIHVHTYLCTDKYKQVQYFRVGTTMLAGASLDQGMGVHLWKQLLTNSPEQGDTKSMCHVSVHGFNENSQTQTRK